MSLVSQSALLIALAASSPVYAAEVKVQEVTEEKKIDFAADQLTYNQDTGVVRAIGHVLIQRDGYTLTAGEVVYNEKTGIGHAYGAVTLTSPNGDRVFAPQMELQDSLQKAFVEDIRLLMADGAQVRAVSGTKDDTSGQTVLKRAVYSPCKICLESEEKPEAPLWQIKAVKVVHDKEKKRLYYEDAILEVFGLPILWTPYFSHPDPTVDKASGVLPLDIQTTRNLGFYIGVPYYHVFNDSQDITVKPIYTTREGFVLQSEYRHHLRNGRYSIGGSITRGSIARTGNEDLTDPLNTRKEFRGHIAADGSYNHTKNWRSSLKVNWASDDTYLRRYDISDADTLTSEYLLEGFFGRSYISSRALAFQGLRIEDVAGLTGHALPLIDAEYVAPFKPLGGTLSVQGNALALHRTDGLDTQRLSLSAKWEKRWVTPKGFIFDTEALVRSDLYNVDDVAQPDEAEFAGNFGASSSEWRNLARVTGTVSWPLVKHSGDSTQTLEPILEVTLSPRRGTPNSIVNEDSRAFELNDLNLFSSDRTSGFDLWEEGSRVTYGLKWRYETGDLSTDIVLGQSLRIDSTDVVLADGAGLEGDSSDIVGRTNINYKGWIDLEHRYRLDDKSFSFRRNEIDVTFGNENASLRVGYLKLNRELTSLNREDREEVRASGFYNFNTNWKLTGSFSRRLKGAEIPDRITNELIDEGSGNLEYSLGVEYQNECIQLGLRWRETFTRDRDIEPGTSIMFRIKLINLG
ncbi:LPS-assembly protein LptD [Kordiimonas sp. SCSIO 12603]|uniref:LPS-assembly protein LptD n=1 Tax=Kordiimonas sp. SCSIO 12603 TaxID=2829596 RepID=UPI002107F3D8|nr:LPS assembly protein LptD [Kordiimonas sp. SCSIO 12603]UTW57349.1 LPS-assembly protein LptD [Kordiimonas sp. SCSIO 12603]